MKSLWNWCNKNQNNISPYSFKIYSVQFSSVAQSCPTLCDPMDCSTPASLSITNSRSLLKLISIETVMPSNHLILCRPLFLLPSIFPSIRVLLLMSQFFASFKIIHNNSPFLMSSQILIISYSLEQWLRKYLFSDMWPHHEVLTH